MYIDSAPFLLSLFEFISNGYTGKNELELVCESFFVIEENPDCFKTIEIE